MIGVRSKCAQLLLYAPIVWPLQLLFLVLCPSAYTQQANQEPPVNTAQAKHTPESLQMLEPQVKAAIEKVLPAMVAVGNRFGRNPEGLTWEGNRFASGVIIREDGLVLSQYHVSHQGKVDFEKTGLMTYGKPGDKVDVFLFDGRRMVAELLGGERLADISLLRLIEPGPYACATLADADSTAIGDWVVKLGHPLGYQPQRGPVARLGKVLYKNPINLVADCITSGGDSGGPLLNLEGKIVGLVQDSDIPLELFFADSKRDYPMAYMSSARIQAKLGSMLAGTVPHETGFAEHFERKRMYAETRKSLTSDQGRDGKEVLKSWKSVAANVTNSIVEVLEANQTRVAFGTVVGTEGWIVTKASVVPTYPRCRLPDGTTKSARVVNVDNTLDLALLKAEADNLMPVRWNNADGIVCGTLVVTVGRKSEPMTCGIVSVGVHSDPVAAEKGSLVSASYPAAFEHDMTLERNAHGGPVLNQKSQAIGITIADAGNHGRLSIPAQAILEFLGNTKRQLQ